VLIAKIPGQGYPSTIRQNRHKNFLCSKLNGCANREVYRAACQTKKREPGMNHFCTFRHFFRTSREEKEFFTILLDSVENKDDISAFLRSKEDKKTNNPLGKQRKNHDTAF
jgi:hypothetical protein